MHEIDERPQAQLILGKAQDLGPDRVQPHEAAGVEAGRTQHVERELEEAQLLFLIVVVGSHDR